MIDLPLSFSRARACVRARFGKAEGMLVGSREYERGIRQEARKDADEVEESSDSGSLGEEEERGGNGRRREEYTYR